MPDLVDNYPELAHLRDIVFMFKLLQSPTSDAFPPVKQWTPTDATLSWSYKQSDDSLSVTAFANKSLKCAYISIDENGTFNIVERRSKPPFYGDTLLKLVLIFDRKRRDIPTSKFVCWRIASKNISTRWIFHF